MVEPFAIAPDPGLYGRSFSDVYDDWYRDISDPAEVVQACSARFDHSARIVEFGSGSARLAAPLAAAGFAVIGIDASIAMLRLSPVTPKLAAVTSDMADLGLAAGCADAVLIAYNTLFNVIEPDRQQQCLVEAHRLLRPGGVLAIDCFIATPVDDQPAVTSAIRSADDQTAVAIITSRERAAGRSQRLVGSHIEVRHDELICRPWELFYRPPGELDVSARAAGFTLDERFADWSGTSFDPLGPRHVSWYRSAERP